MDPNDPLRLLLLSLTPNERRYLTIYLSKEKKQSKLLRLIEFMEGDEPASKLTAQLSVNRSAIAGLKHQAYRTVLRYMRMYNESRTIDYQLHEWIINALFLYERRLYESSLKELERAIEIADRYDRLPVLISLLSLKAKINIERNADDLSDSTIAIHNDLNAALRDLKTESRMKELRERTFLILRTRFQARSSELRHELDVLFNSFPTEFESNRLSYRHHHRYAEANLRLCNNQFDEAAAIYRQLLDAWQHSPSRINSDTLSYSKLLSNYCNALFSAGNFTELSSGIRQMRELQPNSREEEAELFQNTYYLELLSLMNTDEYERLDRLVKQIETGIKQYRTKINKAREIAFYHNIAMAYLLLHNWKKAGEWIEKIILQEKTEHRKDLQHTARMLRLVLWYELGKHDLLEYELVNVERFLRKRKAWFAYESTVVKLFGKLLSAGPKETLALFEKFNQKLAEAIEGKTSASLPGASELTYWVKSKLDGKTMRELLKEEKLTH